jgi:hypothetical protein
MTAAPASAPELCSELAELEEIERQTTKAVNVGTRQHGRTRSNWGLPPHIARASASREKKPPAPQPAKPAPSLQIIPPAPAASIPIPGRVLAVFADYDGLQNAVRGRVDELGFTREALDFLSGNQPGYSGTLLGAAQTKRFGKHSLGSTLGAIGTRLALVEDPAQLEKLKATAEAVAALSKVAALGMSAAEFERLARLTAVRPKGSCAALGDTLAATGCRLALIEDPAQTEKMAARAHACRATKRASVRRSLRGDHVCNG